MKFTCRDYYTMDCSRDFGYTEFSWNFPCMHSPEVGEWFDTHSPDQAGMTRYMVEEVSFAERTLLVKPVSKQYDDGELMEKDGVFFPHPSVS